MTTDRSQTPSNAVSGAPGAPRTPGATGSSGAPGQAWEWSIDPASFPWRFDRGARARELADRFFIPVALMVSITVHVVLALQSTLFSAGGGGAGGGPGDLGAGAAPAGLVAETTLEEFTATELASKDPTDLADLPAIDAPPVDLSALMGGSGLKVDLPSATPGAIAGEGLGGAGSGAGMGESMSDLADGGAGGGGGGGARFFGVEARGSRFAYVVDVSGSMVKGRLDTLKHELTGSIDGLLSASSFLVILFNSDAIPLGGRVRWIDASENAKRRIFEMLGKVVAGGGTEPAEAFRLAFSLKPRPDAIYFMTDGIFETTVAEQVARLNRQERRPVPIHCIAFGSNDAEQLMREIARASGGSYTYIPSK